MRYLNALLVLLTLIYFATSIQAQNDDRRRARQRVLGDIATNRLSPSLSELNDTLVDALVDTDHLIRESGLFAIAGRASGHIADKSPRRAVQWREERDTLLALRDRVVAIALSDNNERVRAAAAFALVHLSNDSTGPKLRIKPDDIVILSDLYDQETSAFNKVELAKHVAVSEPDGSSARQRFILRALSDTNEGVIVYALMGAAAAGLEGGAKEAASHLRSPSRRVRLAAADALVKYGDSGKTYLSEVRDAIDREPDEVVRKTLHELMKRMQY